MGIIFANYVCIVFVLLLIETFFKKFMYFQFSSNPSLFVLQIFRPSTGNHGKEVAAPVILNL